VQLFQQTKEAAFQYLKKMSTYLPIPIYWVDIDGVVQGANELGLKLFDLSSDKSLIGKTLFDLYPQQMADNVAKHNLEVIRTGQIFTQEFSILDEEGQCGNFSAMKIPLQDGSGKIIGIVISPNNTALNKTDFIKNYKKIDEYISTAIDQAKDFGWPSEEFLTRQIPDTF
jgi:hypothetical protein